MTHNAKRAIVRSWEQQAVDDIILEEMITRERELVEKMTYIEETIAETDVYSSSEMYERWLDYDQELTDLKKVLNHAAP